MCAEWSGEWSTTSGTLGDAQTSYTQANDSTLTRVRAACWGYQGVAPGYLNELACTVTGANTVSVNTGGAIVDGKTYANTAAVSVNIPSAVGGGNTRIDRIVIRATWPGTDVLVTRIAGTDAAAPTAPAITETSGTTYDITIAQVLVDTAGTCTVTNERDFASPPEIGLAVLGIATNINYATWGAIQADTDHRMLGRHGTSIGFIEIPRGAYEAGSIIRADMTTGVGCSVIGRAAQAAGVVADIQAGTNEWVLRRSGDTLGFGMLGAGAYGAGSITAGAYGADSITIADIGALVPGFLGRQGGSATDWSTVGTSNYSSGVNVRLQCGVIAGNTATVTFPVPFSNVPMANVSGWNPDEVVVAQQTGLTATALAVTVRSLSTHNAPATTSGVSWIAIGPE